MMDIENKILNLKKTVFEINTETLLAFPISNGVR